MARELVRTLAGSANSEPAEMIFVHARKISALANHFAISIDAFILAR